MTITGCLHLSGNYVGGRAICAQCGKDVSNLDYEAAEARGYRRGAEDARKSIATMARKCAREFHDATFEGFAQDVESKEDGGP